MIKGPKNAVPTKRGWVSPKGELLKSQKITQAQIDEWYGNAVPAPAAEEVVEVAHNTIEVEELGDVFELDFDSMTRAELLEMAEVAGIEFASARPSKRAIIEALQGVD